MDVLPVLTTGIAAAVGIAVVLALMPARDRSRADVNESARPIDDADVDEDDADEDDADEDDADEDDLDEAFEFEGDDESDLVSFLRTSSIPLAATATGVVLVLGGEPFVSAVIDACVGIVAGLALRFVMAIGGMGFSAVDSGYGRWFGETREERERGPSAAYVVYGWLFLLLPPLSAAAVSALTATYVP